VELQRTGLDPYRIAPPDVLSIFVPMLEPKSAEVRAKLAAKGIALDVELPFGNAEFEQLVAPDGRVHLKQIGDVYVCGMTIEEAELAITKKILEICPQASRAAFGVIVTVASVNSKVAHVILEGDDGRGNVCEVPVFNGMTVTCAIRRSSWPHPVDFAAAKIWIDRPSQGGGTIVWPIAWDASKGAPTDATNHAILPGDRLHVELAGEPKPQPPQPVATTLPAIAPPPTPYCAPQPTFAPQLSSPAAPITPYTSSVPSATYYSAFPEPVPSPFARQASSSILSPPLIATQAFISDVPPPTPPAPVTLASPCAAADGACCSASGGTRTAPCASCSECPESSTKVTQVLFNVEVIEDHAGSLQEFKALQSDMRILTAESEVILPLIRLLEKRDLLRRRSSPKIATVVDRPAQLEIGNHERNLMVKTTARELGGGLNVDFQFKDTSGNEALELKTSLLVAHGQTIVMKAGRDCRSGESGKQKASGAAVYVVLTPELVK
jgi:hypothetical protein